MSLPDAKDYALSRATVLTEGYRGLLAVHGGAIAAMLAFASQAARGPQSFIQAIFVALAFFAIGLTLALLIPYFRYINSKAAEERDRPKPKSPRIHATTAITPTHQSSEPHVPSKERTASWYAYTGCQYLSIVAFLAGTSLVAYAGYTEAGAIHAAAIACK